VKNQPGAQPQISKSEEGMEDQEIPTHLRDFRLTLKRVVSDVKPFLETTSVEI